MRTLVSILLGCVMLSLGCSSAPKTRAKKAEVKSRVIIGIPHMPEGKYYGFNIYRSINKKGPFKKINEDLIPGVREPESPNVFIDENVIKDQIYYYYWEGITYDGKSEQLTPVSIFRP